MPLLGASSEMYDGCEEALGTDKTFGLSTPHATSLAITFRFLRTSYIKMQHQKTARTLQVISKQLHTSSTPARRIYPFAVSAFRLAPASASTPSRAAWRCYSTQQESDAKQEEVLRDEGQGTQDTVKENAVKDDDPLSKELERQKKELEAQKKDNLELTVRKIHAGRAACTGVRS